MTNDDATCCGRSLWPAGSPLVNACQLCPNSPTYWRDPTAPPGCTCHKYEGSDDCACLACREQALAAAGCARRLELATVGEARNDRLYDGMCSECFELARSIRMCGMRVAEHALEVSG